MRRAPAMVPFSLLVLAAALGGGCDSGSGQTPLGGGGTGGINVGGSGGGGGGTAGAAMMNCGDPYQPIDPTALIDDMESPGFEAAYIGGRNGAWWAGGDPMSPGAGIQPDGNADAEAISGGRCGSKYAEHVTGHGFSVWAVLSVSMGWGAIGDAGAEGLLPNDNSFRTGVTFWARIGDTSTDKIRFGISDKYSRPEGGYCVDGGAMDVACYDLFSTPLTQLGTDWKQYRIPFGGLQQQHFGLQRPKLDTSSIYTIEFSFNPASTFDFWVDDIEFY